MIGNRIKQLRESAKLTQKELADKIASSSGYISEIENNKKEPGSGFLLSLKRVFGVSVDWILTGEVHTSIEEGTSNPDFELIGDIIEGLETILQEEGTNLPPAKKRRLIELLYKYFKKTGEKADEGVMREHLRLIAA